MTLPDNPHSRLQRYRLTKAGRQRLNGACSMHTDWLKTSSVVCPADRCLAMRNNLVVYRGALHLTVSFAASAKEHFARQIQPHESPH